MLPLLPLLVLIPFIAIVPVLLTDKSRSWIISIAASAAVVALVVACLYIGQTQGFSSLGFSFGYISSLNILFELQLTQLSVILVVMTAIVFLASSLVGKYFIGEGERLYNIVFLVAEGAAMGVFLSANLFLFYVFFEIAEVMMFFIIFIYGSYNRRYAAIKFLVYSIVATLLLLIGIIILYSSVTPHTFNISAIEASSASIPYYTQLLVFTLLLVAFLIKIPVFPFHSWLPDAHTEAPTTGSMVLAGVLLKFGGYGLLLLFAMLPIVFHFSYALAALFGFSAIYAAVVALRQTHFKRMIAYTSIVDMGIVALGLAAFSSVGQAGALYAMLSHGLAISILFLLAGTLDEAYGTMFISKLKGLVKTTPGVTYLLLAGIFVVVGLPLTSGFIGDILIFLGSFNAFGVAGLIPLAAIVVVAGYLFWVIERSFLNVTDPVEPINKIDSSVFYSGALLLLMAVAFGIVPSLLLTGL